jgi:hypothetical protein
MQEDIVDRPGTSASNPSAPRVPNAHLFDAGGQPMLLSVEQGRVYGIDPALSQTLERDDFSLNRLGIPKSVGF